MLATSLANNGLPVCLMLNCSSTILTDMLIYGSWLRYQYIVGNHWHTLRGQVNHHSQHQNIMLATGCCARILITTLSHSYSFNVQVDIMQLHTDRDEKGRQNYLIITCQPTLKVYKLNVFFR